jgi:Fibronectin type III domain/Calcineurin-like phosphoesterase/Carbohydrate binding domain
MGSRARRGFRWTAAAIGLMAVVAAASITTASGATNLLPNGDFEGSGSGSLTGWTGVRAALSLATDGESGTYAARVARKSGATYTLQASPDPVSVTAGQSYTAGGWLRSDTPGQQICLKLIELSAGGATIGSGKQCLTGAAAWASFPALVYKAHTTGDTLSYRIVQTSTAASGQSFEVDNLSLTSAADTGPPTVPTNLTAKAVSSTEVDLGWYASTDDVGVTGYTIYRDGTQIGTVGGSTLTYDDLTAQPSTPYSYTVDAFDAAGNHSDPSDPAMVTTPAGGGGGGGGTLVAAAGDIACDPIDSDYDGGSGSKTLCHEMATSNLILSTPNVADVLALGDDQYECGGFTAFQQSFAPSWGRFLSMIHPVPGNHEYDTSGGTDCGKNAAGYFQYFGAAAGNAQGDYAFDIGQWHLIALNGECNAVGGCGAGSPQGNFLKANLGSSNCTLAYWHQPYYTGSSDNSAYRYFWQTLLNAGADIVLNGHIHTYADFAKQDASGNLDPTGIKQFIVGTGGKSLQRISNPVNVNFSARSYGVLFLTFQSNSYSWQFEEPTGQVLDSGSNTCNN